MAPSKPAALGHGQTSATTCANRVSAMVMAPTAHKFLRLAAICFFSVCCPLLKAGDAPQLLPDANEFRLTLAEDRHRTLPLGPSCTGEAAQTLTCRAFTLTLENLSKKAVRISWGGCNEPEIRIDRKEPSSSFGWFPVSQKKSDNCGPTTMHSLRLKPGEKNEYATRLISPRRDAESFAPGSYTLRAEWVLLGCTEEPEGADCLRPLQIIRPPSSASPFSFQEPVSVISNEVRADSPALPDLGEMKFSFEVNVTPASLAARIAPALRGKCAGKGVGTIECTAFHYKIGNSGTRIVRWTQGCRDFLPEYLADGQWRPVLETLTCTLNALVETPILPGAVVEGDFSLAWGYDISPFRNPGEYRFRLTLNPTACFASPDGRFCLTMYHDEPPVTSSELTVRTQ